jgi:hypothetical protein
MDTDAYGFLHSLKQKFKATTFSKRASLKARMKHIRIILTIASGIVCCLLLIIFLVSYHLDLSNFSGKGGKGLPNDSIALASHFRLGFYEGSMWFYSYEVPYMGSIRRLADEKGVIYKNGHAHEVRDWYWHVGDYGIAQDTLIGERREFVEKDRYVDLPGIYFRYFDEVDSPPPYWTLIMSLWYPISLFAILPALWIYRRACFRIKKS